MATQHFWQADRQDIFGQTLRDEIKAHRARFRRDPEGHANNPEGGQGDGGQEGGQSGDPGGNGAPKGDPTKPEGEPGAPNGGEGAHDPITPERLTSVLDARQRKSEAAFKKINDDQAATKKSMDDIRAMLDKMTKPESDPPAKGSDPKESEEVVQLRRKVDELEKRGAEADERATSEASKRLDYQFETAVKTALQKAGCLDTDSAFLVIKPRLSQSDDGSNIYATVKTQFGEEDLNIDEYITREFAEEVAPYLFKGKVRQGAPAGGDSGGGGGGYTFTKEQLLDNPDLYLKDPEAARAALEAGKVKGVAKPGQALSSFANRR